MNRDSKIIIRSATATDVPTIGRLGTLLVQMHHELDPKRFIGVTSRTPTGYASFLKSQLSEPDSIVLVAEHEGSVAGYSFATIENFDYMSLRGPAAVLQDIIVDPAHREHGIGRVLLDETLKAVKARGAPQAVLSTAARNEAAQRLFARAGFRPTMIEMTRDFDDSENSH